MLFHRMMLAGAPIALVGVAILAVSRHNDRRDILVNIRSLTSQELESDGFALAADQELRVEAVGASDEGGSAEFWAGNAWVLDAGTRKVVWELRNAPTNPKDGGLCEFEGTLGLPAGLYVVHYSSFADRSTSKHFRIRIRGNGRRLTEREIERASEAFTRDAFVSFIGLDGDVNRRIGFSVEEPTEVEIYAIGEADDAGARDYAWVINANTREVVWKLGQDSLGHAGGGAKNVIDRTRLMLDRGSYAAFAVTDGSHDASGWNAPPPYDPEFWGLTIKALDENPQLEVHAYRPPAPEGAFVSLTAVGDDEMVTQGFTLSRPLDMRVYALGEATGGQMHDYGWILDASTRRPVWQMTDGETAHAGGAEKNRVVDRVINLQPGNYIVYYVTDGSHSWSEWNSSPPADPDAWGITLFAADGTVDPDVVGEYDAASDPRIVAQLSAIRDDERRSARFTLDGETQLRVYALGEGSDGDMYDYAWIEDAGTGRTAWEMTYKITGHAGGADKNRMFDGTILLPAGEYLLHYESDGSHSLESWNSTPPADPFNYGVTLFRAGR